MFNTTHHQRNAIKNHSEVSLHIRENGSHFLKSQQITNAGESVEKREPLALLGM